MNTRTLGAAGEQLAVSYLMSKGYEILDRNFHVRKAEIDIIAAKDGCIVFVEVKRRDNQKHGMPKEAVTISKQKSISLASLTYLQKIGKLDNKVRFDVIEILKIDNKFEINHIIQAFDFIM